MFKKWKSGAVQLGGTIVISILVQLISLAKFSIIGANFGAGVELDAFHFDNSLATFAITFLTGGITTVVLPAYVRRGDRRSVDSFLTGIFLVVFALFGGLYLFREPLIALISGKDGDFLSYASGLMLLTIVTQSVQAVVSVTAAHYQARDRLIVPRITSLLVNVAGLVAMALMKTFDIYQYVELICIIGLAELVVDLLIAIRLGFRFLPSFRWNSEETKALFRLFLPVVVSTGVYKIHGLVDTAITSTLETGSLTILSYSNHIATAVNTLVIGNMLLFAYPRVVRAVEKAVSAGVAAVGRYGALFHLTIGLIAVGFVAAGEEFLMLLFGYGKFGAEDIGNMYLCAAIYLFGQQFNVVRDLLYRFCYANKDTSSTLRNSIEISVLNIVLSFIFAHFWQVYGVVIGTVVSSAWSLYSMCHHARKKYGCEKELTQIRVDFFKGMFVSTVCVGVILLCKWLLPIASMLWSMLVYGAFSVVLYLGLSLAVRHGGALEVYRRFFGSKKTPSQPLEK